MKILLASQNQDKLKETQSILQGLSLKVLLPSQVGLSPDFDVAETGKTFKQNAVIKAKAYGDKTKLLSLADDSGLIIDYLNGQPGIHSARFAQGDFSKACQKILKLLKNVPQEKRTARFICTIALYNPQTKVVKTFTGKTQGWIAFKPQGKGGFGYDPIYISNDLNKTFAQASTKEKNKFSHRAQALKKLKNYLQKK